MSESKSSTFVLRYAVIAAVVGGLAILFFSIGNGFGQRNVTAQQFLKFQEGGGVHKGFRRAHAKGFCIAGDFIADGQLEPYSTASVFEQGSTPFTGRISTGGGNPSAPDLTAGVRSLALSIGTRDSERWNTAMNTPPVMSVRNAEDFYKQMSTFAPDPETGERNPEKIAAFFEAHPETKAFREWQASYSVTESFVSERYNSINAFYLINEQGQRQAVRWTAVPASSPEGTTELSQDNPNALRDDFFSRIEQGPVVFDLVFTLATSQDDETDPTVQWPDERQNVVAGQLVIRDAEPQAGGLCNAINFDPLVLPPGMEPTADRILSARSAAYAESYRRRAREHLLNQNKEAGDE